MENLQKTLNKSSTFSQGIRPREKNFHKVTLRQDRRVLEKVLDKIKHLEIQGANAIAMASLNYLKNRLIKSPTKLSSKIISKFRFDISRLINIRPTEPLNYNLLNFIKRLNSNLSANELIGIINWLQNLIQKNNEKITNFGTTLIKNNLKIFMHCHSSAAEKILTKAKKQGKKFKVYNTETRPLFQGRILAKNLLKANIPVTMVADSAASFLISETSGKDLMMDIAILGADAILPDGSVVNKIGSYGIGLTCYYTKVPLYIAASLLKYDVDGIIPIEIRKSGEIWPQKPKKLKIINFAFDKIPAKFITGLITEFGIIKPNQVKSVIKKYIRQGLIAK
jgi:ribose 1,5-bisphosphate isomerase